MTTTTESHTGLDELRAIAEAGAAELGPDATAEQLLAWTA